MKKLLSFFLTICLLVCILLTGLFNLTSSAASSGNYTYTISNGVATITDVNESISGDITIPSTLDKYTVTSIEDYAFSNCTSLKSVTIPNSVTSIGDKVFYECYSLEIVTIGNGVTSIGNSVFSCCVSLKSIIIPDSVISIGDEVFNECPSLEIVTIGNGVTSIGRVAFGACPNLKTVYYRGSESDRANISIDMYNEDLTNAIWHYNSCIGSEYHVYDNACDVDCNICGITRTDIHNYEWVIDVENSCYADGAKHEECTVCHIKRNENTIIPAIGKHTYDNACDAECNVCKQIREISHNYEWVIDRPADCGNEGAKHEECTVCYVKRNENTVIPATGNHTYDNACDTECNVCKQARTVPDHIYDNACDTDCNVCQQVREISHNYEWVVDKDGNCGVNGAKHEECTVCHANRNENTVIPATGKHTYDNDCDKTCNVCENIRLTDDHKYAWVVDKQADCNNDGIKHGECLICGIKQFENTVIPATGNHTYDNACDADCNVCEQIRTVPDHVYDNACDTDCNVCQQVREISHNYEWVVDKSENCGVNGAKHEECTVCHAKRNENTVIAATGNHTYDNACDSDCNVCEQIRTVPDHIYDNVCDATCNLCEQIRPVGDHVYDNACDMDCNICNQIRTVPGHVYDNACDSTCNICRFVRIVLDHVYDHDCDVDCNICSAIRTITHTYSNNCDKSCNICGATRTVGAHKYSNSCDTTCNYCNAKRTIKHTYSNSCDTSCNVCKATRTITHSYKTTTTKATLTKNGSIVKKCTVCGKVASKTTIKYAKTFKLSTTSYTYNGKVKTPSVTVKDSAGKTLKKNTDYTVSYASGRKNVGTYKVTIKGKGNYSFTKTLTFKINPAKTTVSKLTAGKKSITASITKKSTQVTGYQIQYSTSKSFSKATTKTISSYKTTKYTLKSLSAKKTYYVRVRTYKTVGKTKYYSGWSTYKYVKTK